MVVVVISFVTSLQISAGHVNETIMMKDLKFNWQVLTVLELSTVTGFFIRNLDQAIVLKVKVS